MHFPDPVAILVAYPFAIPWRVIDRFVLASDGRNMMVRLPCVGVDCYPTHTLAHHEGFELLTIRMPQNPHTDMPTLPTDQTRNRRAIACAGAMPSLLIGPTARGMLGIAMRTAFLARILVHLVGFAHQVGRTKEGKALTEERLHPMSPLQQLDAIHFQLLCQMLAGRSFEEVFEPQDHDGAGPAGALEHGMPIDYGKRPSPTLQGWTNKTSCFILY